MVEKAEARAERLERELSDAMTVTTQQATELEEYEARAERLAAVVRMLMAKFTENTCPICLRYHDHQDGCPISALQPGDI